jgi:hypothetical protein
VDIYIMKPSSRPNHSTRGYLQRIKRLSEYEDTLAQHCPPLPRHWSLSRPDAFALGHFLECYPRKVLILDVGTFVGMSAFYFAAHPKVVKVISVDPNPTLASEIILTTNLKSQISPDEPNICIDTALLKDLRPLQVAKAALTGFDYERRKIQLREGVVADAVVSVHKGSLESLPKVEVPVIEPSDEEGFVAFLDGDHTTEGVQADLEAIFERNPYAIVFLHDCRGVWGPSVQAGVASFMEGSRQKYHFHLIERLVPGLPPPNLGVIFADMNAAEVEQTFLKRQGYVQTIKLTILSELQNPLRFLNLIIMQVVPVIGRKLCRVFYEKITLWLR